MGGFWLDRCRRDHNISRWHLLASCVCRLHARVGFSDADTYLDAESAAVGSSFLPAVSSGVPNATAFFPLTSLSSSGSQIVSQGGQQNLGGSVNGTARYCIQCTGIVYVAEGYSIIRQACQIHELSSLLLQLDSRQRLWLCFGLLQ